MAPGGHAKNLLVGFIALVASLTGCAPSVLGTQQANPIRTNDLRTATVPKSGTWYVKVPGPVGLIALGTRNQELGPLFTTNNSVKAGDVKSTAVLWFSQIDVRVPEGWALELVGQTAVRTVEEVDGRSYSFFDDVDLTFAVRVPQDAVSGLYSVVANLVPRSDATKTTRVPFVINVGAPPSNPNSNANSTIPSGTVL